MGAAKKAVKGSTKSTLRQLTRRSQSPFMQLKQSPEHRVEVEPSNDSVNGDVVSVVLSFISNDMYCDGVKKRVIKYSLPEEKKLRDKAIAWYESPAAHLVAKQGQNKSSHQVYKNISDCQVHFPRNDVNDPSKKFPHGYVEFNSKVNRHPLMQLKMEFKRFSKTLQKIIQFTNAIKSIGIQFYTTFLCQMINSISDLLKFERTKFVSMEALGKSGMLSLVPMVCAS